MVLTHIKQNHSCVSVEEVAQKQREILKSSCATLDEKLSEGNKALNNISGVMKSLEENASATLLKIQQQMDNVLEIVVEKLAERAEKIRKEVGEIYGEMYTELSKQHGEIKEYIDKVQGSLSSKEILGINFLTRQNFTYVMPRNQADMNLCYFPLSGVENVSDHGTIGPRKFFGIPGKIFGIWDYCSGFSCRGRKC